MLKVKAQVYFILSLLSVVLQVTIIVVTLAFFAQRDLGIEFLAFLLSIYAVKQLPQNTSSITLLIVRIAEKSFVADI